MTVNLKATFKKDDKEYNGLDEEATRKGLIEEPLARRYIVAMVETTKVVKDIEAGGILIPTVKLCAVEVVDGDDQVVVKEILDGRFKRRTGRDVQPSLFDQDDAQAVADAQEHPADPAAVGAILDGALPFLAPPDAEPQGEPEPVADEPGGGSADEPPADKPKRGRR